MPTIGGVVVATAAQAEARRAFSDVIDELSRPIDASDATVRALAGDAFRAAVRTMNRKGLWPWEVQNEQITMTSNKIYSTATGAIKKPLSMHYLSTTTSNPYQRVGYTPYDRFQEKFSTDITGQPHTYTIPNLFETGQIQWFPIPPQNYTLTFVYYRTTPAPRIESESLEIPESAIETYTAFAWYEFIKRTPSAKLMMSAAEALAEARLSFRELSAHVNAPGDRTRETNVNQGWAYG